MAQDPHTQFLNLLRQRNPDLNQLKTLIEQGANVNDRGLPLALALTRTEGAKTVQFLVENGADVNYMGEYNSKPYTFGVSNRPDKLKVLIENGADINAVDSNNKGYSLLHVAIGWNYTPSSFEAVKYLVENGADVNKRSENGITPMQLAEQSDYDDIYEYFQKIKDNQRAKFYVETFVIGKRQNPVPNPVPDDYRSIPELPDDALKQIAEMAGRLPKFGKTIDSDIRYLRGL